jgi:peptidoglycan/xylan/chitin deacetylase (PgdA/CDA1 family)
MAILEDAGYRAVSLLDLLAWLEGRGELPERSAVLTFDDGYADFGTAAFPELERRGWRATVFIPTGHVGGSNRWERLGRSSRPRPLLDWPAIAELAAHGIDFGAHGVWHRDLTRLTGAALEEEAAGAKQAIEGKLRREIKSFAAPYGRSSPVVLGVLRRHYSIACGTTLARARRDCDRYDIPRIEMWYFRQQRRWREFLNGDAEGYFHVRRWLRKVRRLAASIAPSSIDERLGAGGPAEAITVMTPSASWSSR